jgi:hypothetical protein
VFNPLAFERSDLVVAEIVVTEPASGFVVKDRSGSRSPSQIVRTRRSMPPPLLDSVRCVGRSRLGYEVFNGRTVDSGEPVA